jgi:hypothetical protein
MDIQPEKLPLSKNAHKMQQGVESCLHPWLTVMPGVYPINPVRVPVYKLL